MRENVARAIKRNKEERNVKIRCNALYKVADSFNCKLKAADAVRLARAILQKAQILLDEDLGDGVVHLWNKGRDSEVLYCGLGSGRKGERTARRRSA